MSTNIQNHPDPIPKPIESPNSNDSTKTDGDGEDGQSCSWSSPSRSGSQSFYTNSRSGDYTNSGSYGGSGSYTDEEDDGSGSSRDDNHGNDDSDRFADKSSSTTTPLSSSTKAAKADNVASSSSSNTNDSTSSAGIGRGGKRARITSSSSPRALAFLDEEDEELENKINEMLSDKEHQEQVERILAEDHVDDDINDGGGDDEISELGGIEVTASMSTINSASLQRAVKRRMERRMQALIEEEHAMTAKMMGGGGGDNIVDDTIQEIGTEGDSSTSGSGGNNDRPNSGNSIMSGLNNHYDDENTCINTEFAQISGAGGGGSGVHSSNKADNTDDANTSLSNTLYNKDSLLHSESTMNNTSTVVDAIRDENDHDHGGYQHHHDHTSNNEHNIRNPIESSDSDEIPSALSPSSAASSSSGSTVFSSSLPSKETSPDRKNAASRLLSPIISDNSEDQDDEDEDNNNHDAFQEVLSSRKTQQQQQQQQQYGTNMIPTAANYSSSPPPTPTTSNNTGHNHMMYPTQEQPHQPPPSPIMSRSEFDKALVTDVIHSGRLLDSSSPSKGSTLGGVDYGSSLYNNGANAVDMAQTLQVPQRDVPSYNMVGGANINLQSSQQQLQQAPQPQRDVPSYNMGGGANMNLQSSQQQLQQAPQPHLQSQLQLPPSQQPLDLQQQQQQSPSSPYDSTNQHYMQQEILTIDDSDHHVEATLSTSPPPSYDYNDNNNHQEDSDHRGMFTRESHIVTGGKQQPLSTPSTSTTTPSMVMMQQQHQHHSKSMGVNQSDYSPFGMMSISPHTTVPQTSSPTKSMHQYQQQPQQQQQYQHQLQQQQYQHELQQQGIPPSHTTPTTTTNNNNSLLPPPPPPILPPNNNNNNNNNTSSNRQQQHHTTPKEIKLSLQKQSRRQQEQRNRKTELGGRLLSLGADRSEIKNLLRTVRAKIDRNHRGDDHLEIDSNNRNEEVMTEEQIRINNREHLRRSLPQSINQANLTNLAHKKWDRRRIAAMEIQKTVRNLVFHRDLEMVRKILTLLSDEYVMSTNEDTRKGGLMGLSTCAIGLRKVRDMVDDDGGGGEGEDEFGGGEDDDGYGGGGGLADRERVEECKDLILASVVHACQDNSQRVRYYAMESLSSVINNLPDLAVEHFFILFEILRSLWADVDTDVMNGAELLNKKLKEIIVSSINKGDFTADACIPLFARYVHMENRPTRRLTLTWLQEFSDKLIGEPLLEFLHLFICDIFVMLADPNPLIQKESYDFLNSIQPKLLSTANDNVFEDGDGDSMVDFDKILQNLVTTMEHPDPFVRKVAMHWVSKIVQAHIVGHGGGNVKNNIGDILSTKDNESPIRGIGQREHSNQSISSAFVSVRNSLPHVLPGILLSIGDIPHHQQQNKHNKDIVTLESTQTLAEQTNRYLQNAVREEGEAYIAHLDEFIVTLREEIDTHCRGTKRSRRRKPSTYKNELYRKDAKLDGTGIESVGWFRVIGGDNGNDLNNGGEGGGGKRRDRKKKHSPSLECALDWILMLSDAVVPDVLRDEYAEEFIKPIVRLLDNASEHIILKSLDVLAKITEHTGEGGKNNQSTTTTESSTNIDDADCTLNHPMTDANATFALGILDITVRQRLPRKRRVFAALVHALAQNNELLLQLPRIVCHMCTLQPPEFIFISFGLELERFAVKSITLHRNSNRSKVLFNDDPSGQKARREESKVNRDLDYVTKFVQILMNVLLSKNRIVRPFRDMLKNCISQKDRSIRDERLAQLFHILLNTFSHDIVSALTLCIWSGAFRTANAYLQGIDPLDMDLMFFLSLDRFVEALEREPFRDFHMRMLEYEEDPGGESSGAMLFGVLRSMLMLLPQSTSFGLLRERLSSLARFRQSAVCLYGMGNVKVRGTSAEVFVHRMFEVRRMHCDTRWRSIRAESLEPFTNEFDNVRVDESKRSWLGYENEGDERRAREKYQMEKARRKKGGKGRNSEGVDKDSGVQGYQMLHQHDDTNSNMNGGIVEIEDYETNIESYSEMKTNEDTNNPNDDRNVKSNEGKEKWKEYWADADET